MPSQIPFKLTKTDFIQYQNCPKSLWLLKHKPDKYETAEFSLFLQKLVAQGAEVEEWAMKLFPDSQIYTQASFETDNGAFARADILERLDDGTWHIYEIKSSTEVKTDKQHNHLKDACFQKYVMEKSGNSVSKVSIIHLNKEYIKDGEINPFGLLTITDVTDRIAEIYEQTELEIQEALKFLNLPAISEIGCICRENTRNNHCDSFKYFNPDIPEYSIYEIGNIRQNKIRMLIDAKILKITDVSDDFELNDKQILQVESAKKDRAIIDTHAIAEQLDGLKFPIHFIDYETFSNAVPKIDGTKPYQHIPFQVSIHSLSTDGALKHTEFLADKMELPIKILEIMKSATGLSGSFVSWNKHFEIGRNNEMGLFYPNYADYLNYMNENMYDLQDIFKGSYSDYKFHGRTSIKAVLPVLVPNMSYSDLEVRDGTMAMDTWERMVSDPNWDGVREETQRHLLDYCRQDTLAMVEIYRSLMGLI